MAETDILGPQDPQYTREISAKIVEKYSERPMLWNPRDPYYRVGSVKLQAWQQIADECGLDVTTMRKKLNSLLASYRRERARIRQGKKSNWFLYDALKFIPSHVENDLSNATSSDTEFVNEDELENDEEAEITYEDDDYGSVQYFDVPQTQDIFVKEEAEVQVHKPKKMRTIYVRPEKEQPKTKFLKVPILDRTETYTSQSHQAVNPIENVVYKSANEDGKDECDVFGEYIAKSLRKHNDKTRAMIKQAINNIIYEEEMRKYDSDSNVVS